MLADDCILGAVAFIPRKALRARLIEGWTLISGHSYSSNEYAILCVFMGPQLAPSEQTIRAVLRRFAVTSEPMSNRTAAGKSNGNFVRATAFRNQKRWNSYCAQLNPALARRATERSAQT